MDYSEITDNLLIGSMPLIDDYQLLDRLGVRLVINMRFERPPYKDKFNTPLEFLWLPTIDAPLLPIPIKLLEQGVNAALQVFELGGKVYSHCARGIHRSVAMGAAILIAQGFSAQNAMRLIKLKRPYADPYKWYIHRRILRFANKWGKPRIE